MSADGWGEDDKAQQDERYMIGSNKRAVRLPPSERCFCSLTHSCTLFKRGWCYCSRPCSLPPRPIRGERRSLWNCPWEGWEFRTGGYRADVPGLSYSDARWSLFTVWWTCMERSACRGYRGAREMSLTAIIVIRISNEWQQRKLLSSACFGNVYFTLNLSLNTFPWVEYTYNYFCSWKEKERAWKISILFFCIWNV